MEPSVKNQIVFELVDMSRSDQDVAKMCALVVSAEGAANLGELKDWILDALYDECVSMREQLGEDRIR